MIGWRFTKPILLAALAVTLLSGTHHVKPKPGEPLANQLFGAKKAGSKQKPQVYGYYDNGCVAGGEQLPETGPTWQAMRLSRNRNWAHPEMIDFIKRLSVEATKHGWAGLYIGDMTQPRGGPMTSSHASHQIGLDADIWMLPPKRLDLTIAERESLSSISVRTDDQRNINSNWTPAHMEILRAASKDKMVDRIFVAAAVKIEMCKRAGKDRDWLAKIRPLYGHNYHFHVRLKCPKGSPKCISQTPIANISKGDGCDKSLTWWVTDYLNPPKVVPKKKTKKKTTTAKPKPRPRKAREFIIADLPRQCVGVLKSK
ncbi:MAG: penicillin-insensitive murein endopeptidase [Proteobacteria bacterium]|nr:penicillin-insensitive murein endopeptidase [Pseudomonadota bacterium]MDA1287248.1 penicillin-insensitive murein endopeptidase [Pseudomonadota bacterium]